jgi:hypothetical protein
MPVRACPIGEVAASADTVWSLLAEPRHLDLWWDARVERSDPEGPLTPGQRIQASTQAIGRRVRVWFDVEEVDAANRRLRLTAYLPLGIVDHATLTVAPLGTRRSRLSFG